MEPLYILFFVLLGSNFSYNKVLVEGLKEEEIIGGREAEPKQFKYVVAVMYKVGEGAHVPDKNPCTGAIVAEMFIATVAHCFFDKSTGTYMHKEYYIAASITDLRNRTSTTQYISVDLVIMPTYFDSISIDTYSARGNLAVVKLGSSLNIGPSQRILKALVIPKQRFRIPSQIFSVAGYGWNEIRTSTIQRIGQVKVGRTDNKLRYANAFILDDGDCQNAIGSALIPGNMCAKIIQDVGDKKGICQGDSGSPLSQGKYLTGIAMNGFSDCNENYMPGIYINVPFYYHFIKNALIGNRTSIMHYIQLQPRPGNKFRFVEV